MATKAKTAGKMYILAFPLIEFESIANFNEIFYFCGN